MGVDLSSRLGVQGPKFIGLGGGSCKILQSWTPGSTPMPDCMVIQNIYIKFDPFMQNALVAITDVEFIIQQSQIVA